MVSLQHRLKGGGLEGVPRQHRIGVAEDHMVGGLAPAQVVVVHAGQIVMDQRIGVQHLHPAAQGQRPVRVSPGGRQNSMVRMGRTRLPPASRL